MHQYAFPVQRCRGSIEYLNAILFHPMVLLNLGIRLLIVQVSVAGEDINTIALLHLFRKVHAGADRPSGFETGFVPVGKEHDFFPATHQPHFVQANIPVPQKARHPSNGLLDHCIKIFSSIAAMHHYG